MKQGELLATDGIKIDLEREDMLDVIENDLEHHHHIMAYFYEFPKHSVNHQEIYLSVVVQPVFYENFVKHKRSLVAAWGKVLFYEEDYYDVTRLVVQYDSLVKLHLKLYEPKDVKPSVHHKKIEVAYDPYGLMNYVAEKSECSAYQLNYEALDNWRSKFFASYYELYRSINARESYQTLHSLDRMRWLISTMWILKAGKVPNHYLNWSRMEGPESILTTEEQEKLISWRVEGTLEDLKEKVDLILEEFKTLHKEICWKLDLIEDEAFIERILTRIQIK